MIKGSDIKKWKRSGSWDFVVNSRAGNYSEDLKVYTWKGIPVYYRAGTSDAGVINEVLIRPSRRLDSRRLFSRKELEYWVPDEVAPAVILDIGGNVGITSVYFSCQFPKAKIFSFEPVPSNFAVLEKNVGNLENAVAYNFGLGSKDEVAQIFACDDETNAGGFSLYDVGVNKSSSQEIKIRNIQSVLEELDISRVDLIKIDTEGAEYDILMSLDKDILSNVKWIIGELHGNKDFELLAYLSQWFDIDVTKSLSSRLFQFNARNKQFSNAIPWHS
jgi:FkbM family methyltransferase